TKSQRSSKLQVPKGTALPGMTWCGLLCFGAWDLVILWSLEFGIWDFMNRAVFLDRDGTIVVEKNYLSSPDQVEILPGVPGALKKLQDAGFKLFIVTNQSGIGRGYYTIQDMHRVNARLLDQ